MRAETLESCHKNLFGDGRKCGNHSFIGFGIARPGQEIILTPDSEQSHKIITARRFKYSHPLLVTGETSFRVIDLIGFDFAEDNAFMIRPSIHLLDQIPEVVAVAGSTITFCCWVTLFPWPSS